MKFLISLIFSTLYIYAADAFISADFLQENLNNKHLVLIDTTDKDSFENGHIPNAVQVNISQFRHPVDSYLLMNSSKEIEKVARELGISQDSYVVLYGHNKDKELLKASYIALALIVNGFTNVSIYNGGFEDWKYEYKELISQNNITPNTGDFTAQFNPNILVDLDYVKNHIGQTPMIEARPLKYFNGSEQSKGVKRLGHIKGAQSSFWRDKFNADDSLVSDETLNEIFINTHKLSPNKEVIAYCTGGLEASMNWYLLHQYLHFKDVKIYDASMKQWGNLDDTPMEQ